MLRDFKTAIDFHYKVGFVIETEKWPAEIVVQRCGTIAQCEISIETRSGYVKWPEIVGEHLRMDWNREMTRRNCCIIDRSYWSRRDLWMGWNREMTWGNRYFIVRKYVCNIIFCSLYLLNRRPYRVINFAIQRLETARQFGDKAAMRRAYTSLANAHVFLPNMERAMEFYRWGIDHILEMATSKHWFERFDRGQLKNVTFLSVRVLMKSPREPRTRVLSFNVSRWKDNYPREFGSEKIW